MVDVHIL